ncbi:DMT family transporter [Feifania hominis]|uniref:DMT family transporter n=1 Tax=Feifania hominis TaxID=2763660 RepID=A0A926DD42_9FIRM|nr:DMT family transporter [Feifania hominis]MBC8536393.1 DMT family transporter [Feifania hominis]
MGKRQTLGMICSVASAALFGLCAALTKLATARGASVGVILFARGLLGAAFLLPYGALTRRPVRVSRGSGKKVLLLGLVGTAATLLLLNLAYCFLPVGTVTTIHFLYPAAVSAISALLFHEKIPPVTAVALAVSTGAMALFFERFTADALAGLLCAAASVFTWAFQLLYLDRSGLLHESKSAVAFWMCCITAAVGAGYGLLTGEFALGVLPEILPVMAVIAVLNNVLATVLCAAGVEHLGAGTAAVFSVFEPIASIAFGALLLRESLSAKQIAASTAILLSIFTLVSHRALTQRKSAKRRGVRRA